MNQASSPIRSVIGVVLLMIAIGSLVTALILSRRVIGREWIIWSVAFFVAITTGFALHPVWQRLTGHNSPAISILLNIVLFVPLTSAAILLINDMGAISRKEESGTVTRLFTETRHHTRRVTRRYYVQGPPYKVFRMTADLPGIGKKSMDIKKNQYDRLIIGDTVRLEIEKGLLGITTYNPKSLKLPKHATAKRKRETLREKRHKEYREKVRRRNERYRLQ